MKKNDNVGWIDRYEQIKSEIKKQIDYENLYYPITRGQIEELIRGFNRKIILIHDPKNYIISALYNIAITAFKTVRLIKGNKLSRSRRPQTPKKLRFFGQKQAIILKTPKTRFYCVTQRANFV